MTERAEQPSVASSADVRELRDALQETTELLREIQETDLGVPAGGVVERAEAVLKKHGGL